MRTCPHMSPGCSSPRDLNIAPARHYCCHSQTHSDLLTSPAQKRLDADTFTANVFHQCKKKRERERETASERRAPAFSAKTIFYFYLRECLVVPSSTKILFDFCRHWLKAGRWWAHASIRRLDVSQHLMHDRGSEVGVWRPPTCVIVEPGRR